MRVLICGDSGNLETMLSGKDGLTSVKTAIFVDAPTDAIRQKAQENGIKVYTFEEVEVKKTKNPSQAENWSFLGHLIS